MRMDSISTVNVFPPDWIAVVCPWLVSRAFTQPKHVCRP
jgi:hypothetical protein